MNWLQRLFFGLLLSLALLQPSFASSATVLSAQLTPEARERAITQELKKLIVPAPAGWEIIRNYNRWLQLEHELVGVRYIIYNPWGAINYVFGPYASQANAVASCESGHSIYAQNGQFLGLFQMGTFARSTYGHGSYALAQARAAYRYFAASGFTWGPWECKP